MILFSFLVFYNYVFCFLGGGGGSAANVCWVGADSGGVPSGGMQGGDDNGEPMFVARASFEGALIPGKLVPSHGVCYVPWGGAEHGVTNYEVLCECNGNWVSYNKSIKIPKSNNTFLFIR